MDSGMLLGVGALAAIFVGIMMFGGNLPQQAGTGTAPSGINIVTSAATVRVSAVDLLAGTTPANINTALLELDKKTYVAAEQDATTKADVLSTAAPNTFNGYLLIGNDNYLAGGTSAVTDRGAEYYYQTIPVSWANKVTHDIPEVKACLEGTYTYSSLVDAGTAEIEDDTFSVAVGSGATVDTTKVTVSVGTADSCLGKPTAAFPLAYCFNTTAAGNSFWEEVRPLNFAGTVPVPLHLAGNNVLGGVCYQLPTKLMDSTEPGTTTAFEWALRLRAKSGADPTAAHNITGIPLDACDSANDAGVWVEGYGSDTRIVTAEDCGIDGRTTGSSLLVGIS